MLSPCGMWRVSVATFGERWIKNKYFQYFNLQGCFLQAAEKPMLRNLGDLLNISYDGSRKKSRQGMKKDGIGKTKIIVNRREIFIALRQWCACGPPVDSQHLLSNHRKLKAREVIKCWMQPTHPPSLTPFKATCKNKFQHFILFCCRRRTNGMKNK